MSQHVLIEIELPTEQFHFPEGVQQRLQDLLDRQDSGTALTPAAQREAEGLVHLAELLSLLQMRAQRAAQDRPQHR